MKVLIADTETTGAEPPEVIELAWMEPLKTDGDRYWVQRYKPQKQTTLGALVVHGILPEELEQCPPSATAALPADCTHLIGHNIDYDWTALGKPPIKRICTLAIARALYPELDSHKLGAMVYALKGVSAETRSYLQDAHSAAADVDFCYKILVTMLLNRAPEQSLMDPERLWAFSEECRLPKVMPFGKHKGLAIEKLPGDYVSWMLRQPDMDEYVIKAVKKSRGMPV